MLQNFVVRGSFALVVLYRHLLLMGFAYSVDQRSTSMSRLADSRFSLVARFCPHVCLSVGGAMDVVRHGSLEKALNHEILCRRDQA